MCIHKYGGKYDCWNSISEILHIITEPAMIWHIAKDCFHFKNRLDKHCPSGTTLSTRDIKSLYTSIWDDPFYTEVEYWIGNCKMIYRYCHVSISNLSLKACPLF